MDLELLVELKHGAYLNSCIANNFRVAICIRHWKISHLLHLPFILGFMSHPFGKVPTVIMNTIFPILCATFYVDLFPRHFISVSFPFVLIFFRLLPFSPYSSNFPFIFFSFPAAFLLLSIYLFSAKLLILFNSHLLTFPHICFSFTLTFYLAV